MISNDAGFPSFNRTPTIPRIAQADIATQGFPECLGSDRGAVYGAVAVRKDTNPTSPRVGCNPPRLSIAPNSSNDILIVEKVTGEHARKDKI